MIDNGLLATMVIVVLVPAVFVTPWPAAALPGGLLEHAVGPLMAGLAAGRLASMVIDDPSSITRLNDVLIIRSGVEFWVGVAAAMLWVVFRSHREHESASTRLAALSMPALAAWAAFEATCVLRDGCPGPVSDLGLRPTGLNARMFPVGLAVAGVAALGACAIRRLHRGGLADVHVVVLTILVIATIRSTASIWLPKVGDGLTRQHRESIAVTVMAAGLMLAALVRSRQRLPGTLP